MFVLSAIIITSLAGYLKRHGHKPGWHWLHFLQDLLISVTVGFMGYFLMMGATGNEWLAVGAASYLGHVGPMGLDLIKNKIKDL
ncbi:MAG: phage holin family protein [Patescibacteria group bacterium]|nr:phage holin family protein [Patescibacteria group bacterium]